MLCMTKYQQRPRIIKVNRYYYDYRPKDASPNFCGRFVSIITLKGDWLKKAGFKIGDKIEITVNTDQLVIAKVKLDSSQKELSANNGTRKTKIL